MADITGHDRAREGNRWSIAIWGFAALLLLTPLVAMQFTKQVDWDVDDFVLFGVMLAAACGTYELAARTSANGAYRAGTGLAVVTAVVLVWMNLAVGIIGNEDNPANLMFGGVLAVGFIGGLLSGFRPRGMAVALLATAVAQVLVAVIALVARLEPPRILILTALYVAFWLASAGLYWKAAGAEAPEGAAT